VTQFVIEEKTLELYATRIAAESSIGSHDAMAWHYHRDGILVVGTAHGA
jgi:hypothetical protein